MSTQLARVPVTSGPEGTGISVQEVLPAAREEHCSGTAATGEGPLALETVPLAAYPNLERDWRALEELARPEFFLSWHWIGVWLDVYRPDAMVLRARKDERVVGLGILVPSKTARHLSLLRARTLLLNQTGDKRKDQVWIEYNGMLVEPDCRVQVYGAAIQHLLQAEHRWDEVTVGGIDVSGANALLARVRTEVWQHRVWRVPCYGVRLNDLRDAGTTYLASLSRNSRHQIRRSHKIYCESGEVTIATPRSTGEALVWLDRVAELHLARWGAGLDRSGFANPEFVSFHRALIRKLWSTGLVELLEVRAGERVIAGFLNFVYRNRVYFYLSGIVEEQDNRLKPGLLGHALCIQRYLEQGIDFYDFMGGDEHYKTRLGIRHNELVRIVIQKKRLKFGMEHLGRRLKHLAQRRG